MIKKLFLFSVLLICFANAFADTPEGVTKVTVLNVTDSHGKQQVQIQLSNAETKKPLTPSDLKTVHTKKLHLLIIDSKLEDYFHVHPKPTLTPGIYEFEWEPKREGYYRAWADIIPLDTNSQEYAITDLTTPDNKKTNIDRTVALKKIVGDYTFQLSFEPKVLKAGQDTMGMLVITDANNRPVKNLEPLMGAFAHIVGFEDDFKSVLHIHPIGKEPTSTSERGGPKLKFHFEPQKPGFIKLFAQVVMNGKEFFVPFGVTVTE